MLELFVMPRLAPQRLRHGPLELYVQSFEGDPDLQPLIAGLSCSSPVIWLDSARHHPVTGRWSILGYDPWLTLLVRGSRIELRTGAATHMWRDEPLRALREILRRYHIQADRTQVPLRAVGLLGFLSYDLNRWIERLPSPQPSPHPVPEMLWYGMRRVVLVDHLEERSWVVCLVDPHRPSGVARREALEALEQMNTQLACRGPIDPSTRAPAMAGGPSLGMSPPTRRGVVLSERPSTPLRTLVPSPSRDERSESKDDGSGAPGLPGGPHEATGTEVLPWIAVEPPRLEATSTQAEFERMVSRALEHIGAGDIFQANLSQRFSTSWADIGRRSPSARVPWGAGEGSALHETRAWALSQALREINPSPFACFLSCDELSVVSCSPERLVRVQEGRIDTRPIAGTRPRGATSTEDAIKSLELLVSEKERAEHLMLVDLARNDLGRVCVGGSVQVGELMGLEAYSHVFHIISDVSGRLRKRADAVDVIRAVFPGGTITGCPKVRCMQILRTLEPVPRGLYTGSLGTLGFDGTLDLNIAIRTMLIQGEQLTFHVGAGIVADSDPEREYHETLAKAQALMIALQSVQASGSGVGGHACTD